MEQIYEIEREIRARFEQIRKTYPYLKHPLWGIVFDKYGKPWTAETLKAHKEGKDY